MADIDRRAVLTMLTAAGLIGPGAALAAAPRMFKAKILLENNRVVIAVEMNGKGPYIFMIDTGTYVSLIRPDLAKELKLPVQGHEQTRGVGGKQDGFAIHLAKDFIIGGTIRQPAVALEASFDFGYQQDIYGALAAGVLTTVDTDLDLDAGELRIYPDGRGERPGYVALDSEIPRIESTQRGSRKIAAALTLDGRPIRCMLDTGSPAHLLLNRTASRRLELWDDNRPYAPNRPQGIGRAGPVARTIRAGSLIMGDSLEDRPLISLLGNDIGDDFDGIVGMSFLRRFNMSIDTRGRKLWVQPSHQKPAPERYGLSGLWLDQEGERIEVEAVGTGSPAAAAGIVAGDRIVDMSWRDALAAITGPPGRTVRLKVERGTTRREVEFALKLFL